MPNRTNYGGRLRPGFLHHLVENFACVIHHSLGTKFLLRREFGRSNDLPPVINQANLDICSSNIDAGEQGELDVFRS